MQNQITFGSAISYSIERLKHNPWFYVTAGLTLIIIPQTISQIVPLIIGYIVNFLIEALGGGRDTAFNAANIVGITFGILLNILIFHPFVASFYSAMKLEKGSGKASLGDLFKFREFIINSNIAGLLTGLIISIGYLFCIIPGFLISPIYAISLIFVSQGQKPLASISNAFDFIKNNFMKSMFIIAYVFIYGFFGLLLCGVGMWITIPMCSAAIYFLVNQTLENNQVTSSSNEQL